MRLLMVSPAAFGPNAETADSNRFQQAGVTRGSTAIVKQAQQEFAAAYRALSDAGIEVCVAQDSATPAKPDAVFPNNWVSFHEDGTLVLYPMLSPLRRLERREAIIDQVKLQLRFTEKRRVDLTALEQQGQYLEGTGSLVLDRENKIAYACRSPRTDEALARQCAIALGCVPVIFDARDRNGHAVYHTNVVAWIGPSIAAVGIEAIAPADRARVLEHLQRGPAGRSREVLQLGFSELEQFAGNMLQVQAISGSVLIASDAAVKALSPQQHRMLEQHCDQLVRINIPTIERYGGGSIRCMLCEVPCT